MPGNRNLASPITAKFLNLPRLWADWDVGRVAEWTSSSQNSSPRSCVLIAGSWRRCCLVLPFSLSLPAVPTTPRWQILSVRRQCSWGLSTFRGLSAFRGVSAPAVLLLSSCCRRTSSDLTLPDSTCCQNLLSDCSPRLRLLTQKTV